VRANSRVLLRSGSSLAVGVGMCLALGVLSLGVPSGMGYDSWAWLVWGREVLHFALDTEGGPSWKPLPVILIAPFTPFEDVAPAIWLGFSRAAAFAALLLAYRVAARIAGSRLAGVVAAAALALSADFFVTALRGYSEPLLIALVLAAIDQHLAQRRLVALTLVAFAGLLRPEVWIFGAIYGGFLAIADGRFSSKRARFRLIALVAVAPALWLTTDLLGSGNPLQASKVATTAPQGSAATSSAPAVTVVERAGDAVILPVVVLFLAALGVAVWRAVGRRRVDGTDRAVMWLAGLALGWTMVVATMAEMGYAGRRRYLALAAAIMCVVAAIALVTMISRLPLQRIRQMALGGAVLAFLLFGFSPARADYRLISLAAEQKSQNDELGDAVVRAGGPERVAMLGSAVINPFLHTALAWKLDQPLRRVRATWSSSRRKPNWSTPAVLFRAPPRLAGPRPAIPRDIVTRQIARAGRWRVMTAR
jgi:hypothetical protein